jgi:hypothetical protein
MGMCILVASEVRGTKYCSRSDADASAEPVERSFVRNARNAFHSLGSRAT